MAVESFCKQKEIDYPALMEYNLCGERFVVLMSEPGVGMVVKSNSALNPVGCYRTDWAITICGILYFRPHTNEIILRNVDRG